MVSMPSAAISVAYESSPVVGGTARSRTQDALQVQADIPPRPFVPPVRFKNFSCGAEFFAIAQDWQTKSLSLPPLIRNTG